MRRSLSFPLSRALTAVVAAVLVASLGVVSHAGAQPKLPAQAPAKVPATAAKRAAAAELIDINRASAAELEAIPGIGKAFASRIIGGRPYANKAQLVQKKILGQALYDRVKDRIIARQ